MDYMRRYAEILENYNRELERNSQILEWERNFRQFIQAQERQERMLRDAERMEGMIKKWVDAITPPPPKPAPVASPKDAALTSAIDAVHAGRNRRPMEWPEW